MVYTVQPILYLPRNATADPAIALPRIDTVLGSIARITRDDVGVTFTPRPAFSFEGIQTRTHFQNAFLETGADACDPEMVWVFFYGKQADQAVGTVGPDYFGCVSDQPGRVLAFWAGSPTDSETFTWEVAVATLGAFAHELGHAFGLRHPLPAFRQVDSDGNVLQESYADFMLRTEGVDLPQGTVDPRSIGPNKMGGGWVTNEPFHELDKPILRASPFFESALRELDETLRKTDHSAVNATRDRLSDLIAELRRLDLGLSPIELAGLAGETTRLRRLAERAARGEGVSCELREFERQTAAKLYDMGYKAEVAATRR